MRREPHRDVALVTAALLLAGAPAAAPAQGLGIDLSAPKKKEEKKPPEKPAEKPKPPPPSKPLTFEPLSVTGKSAGKQRLEAAKRLFDDKSYETAALAYYEILREPSLGDAHDEARYQLAKSLAKMRLYHSALARFDDILARGAQGSKYFHTSLEWLFYIGRRTANEHVILSQVARFANESFPPAYQDRFYYLLSKYNYERGRALTEAGQVSDGRKSYDEARRLAALVKPAAATAVPSVGEADDVGDVGDPYAKARFIDGMVLYAQGNPQAALEDFKDVVRLTNPKRARQPDTRLRELAFLQLARIHYEHRQNRYAIFYYGKMPWGEERWLEGLWESSYAYYRIGDYERSLGNLLTLHSPYFRDEYFPESHILKAIIYYENCRYPEARSILEDFGSMYDPVYSELVRLTARGGPPASYFDLIEDTEKAKARGEGASLMRKIMNIAFTDKNIKRLNDSILEIENEMDVGIGGRKDAFRSSGLAKDLVAALKSERGRLVDEAGARARQKLEYERDELRTLLEQALRIKIEVSRKQREALESSLARGGPVDVVRAYRYSVAVSDEHLYWPYEGEFWRDELGTYAYTLTKGCRAELAAPVKASR